MLQHLFTFLAARHARKLKEMTSSSKSASHGAMSMFGCLVIVVLFFALLPIVGPAIIVVSGIYLLIKILAVLS